MSKQDGRFVWYELMTTDPKKAAAFYREVVGWDSKDSGMPGMNYTLFNAGETGVAGLMELPKEAADADARPGWIGYVAVDDVDAAVAKVKAAGGSVHKEPADIPDVGRFAVVADPQGATLALFKGGGDMPEPAPDEVGHGRWHELYAANWESAFDFYAELFAWRKADAMDMGEMGTYQIFAEPQGKAAIGGMMNKPAQIPAPTWRYYFTVDSVEAAKMRVERAGGTVTMGPHQVPGGSWIIHGIDPQGADFALHSAQR